MQLQRELTTITYCACLPVTVASPSYPRLVTTLEEIAARALDKAGTGGSWKETKENFAVSSSAVMKDTITENGFSISFDGSARARLSSNLFNDRSCNSSVVISSAINANKAELFGGAVEGEVDVRQIVSSILSVTVGNCTVSGSTEAIEMTFTVPQVICIPLPLVDDAINHTH